jgi:osmotically-inducible protein OsmY
MTSRRRWTGVRRWGRAIAEVHLPQLAGKPDPEIARELLAAIQDEVPTASDAIRVGVSGGSVRLEGEVEWRYERVRSEAAARACCGTRRITNRIVVRPKSPPDELRREIRAAFERSAEIDADAITVGVGDNGTVILRGLVSSHTERDPAECAAWSIPAVKKVDNRIEVRTDLSYRIEVTS